VWYSCENNTFVTKIRRIFPTRRKCSLDEEKMPLPSNDSVSLGTPPLLVLSTSAPPRESIFLPLWKNWRQLFWFPSHSRFKLLSFSPDSLETLVDQYPLYTAIKMSSGFSDSGESAWNCDCHLSGWRKRMTSQPKSRDMTATQLPVFQVESPMTLQAKTNPVTDCTQDSLPNVKGCDSEARAWSGNKRASLRETRRTK
jgi:hypothetical protein